MVTRAELAEEFRTIFGHETHQRRPGDRLVSIEPMLAKLRQMQLPLERVAYMSRRYSGGRFLKLHLTNKPGEKQCRVLHFDADQNLVKGE
jgi:hypothetical protein